MDKYEKLYNEALERARKIHNEILDNEILGFPDQIREIFPELRGSEDERIRKWLVDYFSSIKEIVWIHRNTITCEQILDWLEKQKENPKNAISIPADCASNARCPYKIHGDEDFIGDIKDTPAYHFGFDEGVRSEREKQKEQKPVEKQDYSGLNDLERAIHRGFLCAGVKNVPVGIIKETAQDCLAHLPAKWSEGDEKIMQAMIKEGDLKPSEIAWLKSLRPSWKPSEEQMGALQHAIDACESEWAYQDDELRSLLNDIKKL